MKQRLIGAAVLVALAVIFLPMLVQDPAPDSGVSDVSLSIPDTPRSAYETRDLPLVTPGKTPDGGALGMQSRPPVPSAAGPTPATVVPATVPSAPPAADAQPQPLPQAAPEPVPDAPLPVVSAAGDYAVNVGTYANQAAADAVLGALRATQLPARREAASANGKPAWRVQIGPYASRADAETARLRAAHVRDGSAARVVALDAAPATPRAASSDQATVPPAAATPSTGPAPAASLQAATGFTVQLAAYRTPAEATALRDKLRAAGFIAFTELVDTDKGALTRVRVGPVITRADADQLKAQVNAKVGLNGIVRPYP